MYTWEIEKLLKLRNYLLTGREHEQATIKSPQVKTVHYNACEDSFEIWTKEDNNAIKYFKYKVKKIKNNN